MNKLPSFSIFKQTARIIVPGILFLMLMNTGCKNDPREISALTGKGTNHEDVADEVTIIYSQHGKTKFRIFAHKLIRNESVKPPYTDMKNGVKAEIYDDSLNVTSTITANYARYYEKEGYILVRNNVVIVNRKGEKLNTEELVWNQKINKIYTEKFVKITTPTNILYGDGLEANEDFSSYQITNIKGSILVNKSEVPQ